MHKIQKNRIERDFYETPVLLVEKFLRYLSDRGSLYEWSMRSSNVKFFEPAAGSGNICQILKAYELTVWANEIRVEESENLIKCCDRVFISDFLIADFAQVGENWSDWVFITNPPFSLGMEFVEKIVGLNPKAAYLLLPLAILAGKKRRKQWEKIKKPTGIVPISERQKFRTDSKNRGFFDVAWFMWENGKPELDLGWI